MNEAKAIINIKEGIIELQGPVEFVRTYLDRYHDAVKGRQGEEERKESPQVKAEPVPEKEPASPEMPVTCIGTIRDFIISSFFNEQRSFVDVKKQFGKGQVVYPDKTIRAGLSRLVKTGVLGTNGKRRGLRYSQI
jgi:hypothetical protein